MKSLWIFVTILIAVGCTSKEDSTKKSTPENTSSLLEDDAALLLPAAPTHCIFNGEPESQVENMGVQFSLVVRTRLSGYDEAGDQPLLELKKDPARYKKILNLKLAQCCQYLTAKLKDSVTEENKKNASQLEAFQQQFIASFGISATSSYSTTSCNLSEEGLKMFQNGITQPELPTPPVVEQNTSNQTTVVSNPLNIIRNSFMPPSSPATTSTPPLSDAEMSGFPGILLESSITYRHPWL